MSTKEQKERIDLLQGTLDLLILRTLLRGPAHGHTSLRRSNSNRMTCCRSNKDPSIRRCTGSSSAVGFRSKRAPRRTVGEPNSTRLTAKGRRQLTVETTKWDKLAGAIAQILRPVERTGES